MKMNDLKLIPADAIKQYSVQSIASTAPYYHMGKTLVDYILQRSLKDCEDNICWDTDLEVTEIGTTIW